MREHQVRIEVFGQTDPGKVRRYNQDQFLIADLAKNLEIRQTSLETETGGPFVGGHARVLLVADGMGGHAAGGEASAIAVETIRTYLIHTMPWVLSLGGQDERLREAANEKLRTAVELSHQAVLAAGRARPDREGMGTTMTLAFVVWPWLYLVHVGDSRCYLLRDGSLERVTRDHTYAQKLIEEGGLTPAQAEDSFLSNVLTRVIGGDTTTLKVDAHRMKLLVGDRVLLSTDGLNKHVKDLEIAHLLEHSGSAEEACGALIEAALEGGGTDNVTVVVGRFLAPEDEPS